MAILKYSDYFKLVLETLRDEGPLHRHDLRDRIAENVQLSDEERRRTNARGTNIFGSRIHWSGATLVLAGLLERPSRGQIGITPLGRQLLEQHPDGITEELVKSQAAFIEMAARSKENRARKKLQGEQLESVAQLSDQTPLEQLESAVSELEASVASDLVARVQELPPKALELLILKLVRAMGYGASEEMFHHVGGSGDEGIDGVIFQDQLGFHRIYLQAKRYRTGSNIATEQMNSFIGAIERKSGIGGVFVTTSDFSDGAKKAAQEAPKHIALMNGFELGQNLIDYQIGVRFPKTYREVELDESYFDELLNEL